MIYNWYNDPTELYGFKELTPTKLWGILELHSNGPVWAYPHDLGPFENIIAQDPEFSYEYARNGLCDRFRKGEATIATSAEYSYMYATYVLHDVFPLGENIMKRDSGDNEYWDMYSSEFKVKLNSR